MTVQSTLDGIACNARYCSYAEAIYEKDVQLFLIFGNRRFYLYCLEFWTNKPVL